ncbi:MAG: hypothetical protein ACOX1T_06765, partial [Saccharofermentanales bacterium]
FLQVLSTVLNEKIASGYFSEDLACSFAKAILYEIREQNIQATLKCNALKREASGLLTRTLQYRQSHKAIILLSTAH